MTDESLKTNPETPEEPISEESTAESGGDQDKAPVADDFRDALSNLSSALDRFGRATEARARQEWRESKPEIQHAVDEVKRGLEGLVRKSGGAVDSISKRLNRDDAAAKPAGDTPESATEAAEFAASTTSDNGTAPSNEQP